MTEGPNIALLASLIGDPGRSNMLLSLLRVPALTATELADEGGVTAATASSHLHKLLQAGLLRVRPGGRHRFYMLADDEVAQHLERMLCFAQHLGHVRTRPGPNNTAMRRARVCYDHLAGSIAVTIFDQLIASGGITRTDGAIALSDRGRSAFGELGIGLHEAPHRRRECRECLDWSERRSHLAGAAGAALLKRIVDLGWVRKKDGSRVLCLTPTGERYLPMLFTVE